MASPSIRKHDVLVLGGGFAGIYTGKALAPFTRRKPGSTALIARENHMVFQPMLPEVAGSSLSPRDVVNAIRQLCRGCEVYKGELLSIDLQARQVVLHAGPFTPPFSFAYDHLVLTLGAVVDLSRIPGMAEHAFVIQNVGDAMKLRAAVIARMEEANVDPDLERRRSILQFLVVGGGYSGVETAGQLLDLLEDVHHLYPNIEHDDFSVTLVHSRDHLLPTLRRSLGEYTARKLTERGLRLILNERVKSVTARQVRLASGTILSASLVVCTVGNAPHPLILQMGAAQGVPLDHGRVITDATCAVPGFPGLWAAGDCAAVPLQSEGTSPPTAQFAMRQGKLLGENLVATLNDRPTRPFTFTGLGEFAAIGHQNAVGEVFGWKVSGFFAWWMWRTVYLSKLPGLERKLRVMVEWTLEVFFSRDINLLTPQYTTGLSEMHLEPGDQLFHVGEPAFSFYIVKQGQIEIRDADDSLVRTIDTGGYFGERALLTDKTWRFNARAAAPTELVVINQETFTRITSACSSFQTLLAGSAATWRSRDELDRLESRIPEERRHAPVSSIMARDPVTLTPDLPADAAMAHIQAKRHGAYPLVDTDGQVLGLVRRTALFEWFKHLPPSHQATLATAPLTPVPHLPPDTPLDHVLESLVREGSTRALVTDETNRLLGVVTLSDLLLPAPAEA